MIEIKGNFGKSVIFEHLMNESTLGLTLGIGFPIIGDNIYSMNDDDKNIAVEDIINFIKEYFNYEFHTIMIYSNWDYAQIKPVIDYCKEEYNQRQCIIFYRQ